MHCFVYVKDIIPHEYAEALKDVYPKRCYFGCPDYTCQYCGAVFLLSGKTEIYIPPLVKAKHVL
ncbi:unnamed protein product [Urochloa humidicola]